MGIPLYTTGTNTYTDVIKLTDNTYFDILNANTLCYTINPNTSYFQTREISQYILAYLHDPPIQNIIKQHNPFKDRYSNNNDIFIHIRLGDVIRFNPGVDYYKEALQNVLSYDNIYIGSDSPKHNIIHSIIKDFPNTKICHMSPVETIQFGSTCKHVVLSHGSFSAVIGWISSESTSQLL